jgi:hypothetical protein
MAKTAVIGLTKTAYGTNVQDGAVGGQPTEDDNLDKIDAAIAALQQGERDKIEVEAASGAIGIVEGLAIITMGSAAALTLAAPTPGGPGVGDDGKHLAILSTTAFAHVVTTPANKINGSKLTATFAAAVASSIEFIAYNGVWYQQNTPQGVTLT